MMDDLENALDQAETELQVAHDEIDALRAENAALRAQLAEATTWWPVTEEPGEDGLYVIGKGTIVAAAHYVKETNEWESMRTELPIDWHTHWRMLQSPADSGKDAPQ